MVARVAGLLLDESEKLLPPGVIGVGKQLFSERFQVINAYRLDVLLDRFASILVDLFNIKILGFHAGRLIPRLWRGTLFGLWLSIPLSTTSSCLPLSS